MPTDTAFWDTSALVPLCCRQAASLRARQLRRNYARVAVWWGCQVEAHSALQRLRAGSLLSAGELQWGSQRLEVMCGGWLEVKPVEKVRVLAVTLPAVYSLRALDSFQLAAALVWCQERPRQRHFVCFDEKLAEAAGKAGFTVVN